MSGPAIPNGTPESVSVTRDLELDVPKLHSLPSEQQDLFLLTFLSDLVHHVQRLDTESLSIHQSSIKKQLISILSLSCPAPSRPIRDNLGHIYVEIFTRGSRSLLFESINELLAIINAGKSDRDLKDKHAAVVCLGHILQIAGDSAVSLCGLTFSSLLKLLKQAHGHAGLRAAIYKSIGRAVKGFGSSLDEQSARDAWKSARAAASNEKAMLSQKTACYCLERLVSAVAYFDNATDFEALKTTAWKTFDSRVASVRHAAASCLASAFVKLFSESEVDSSTRSSTKRSRKMTQGLDSEDAVERTSVSTSKKNGVLLSLNLDEILQTLAGHYTKSSTTNRARAGIVVCYKYALLRLPEKVIEERYSVIATHLFNDLLEHPTILTNRHRLLLTRRMVRAVLDNHVGFKILSESAQLNATHWLLNDVLKNFPHSLPDRRDLPKQVIIAALSSLSSLLSFLGPAAGTLADVCREALFQVLQHPSYTVQIHASQCLRALVLACPQQLLVCANSCIHSLEKNVSQLDDSRLHQRRSVGYATALAAVIGTSRSQPLYGSVKLFSQVLDTATDLLKASSGTELRVSATQIQIAWTLIGGLMPLGPNFVKIHLSQLLLLWRNALPRPLTQDNATRRGSLEVSFLAHVRECALGALLVFLEYNGTLITTDGSRRIAMMLQNSVSFMESVPIHRQSEEVANRLMPALQLPDLMIMVQRRVLQCFTILISQSHLDHAAILSQSNLMGLAITIFAEPESASHQKVGSSIAISASNFESLWETADNWGFGVNGLIRGYRLEVLGRDRDRRLLGNLGVTTDEEEGIDDIISSPICRAWEHDSLHLYLLESHISTLEADPPPTQVINAAIDLFAVALPLQPLKVQESSLEQLAMLLSRPYSREPGKKAALRVNIATAILCALVVANRETRFSPGKLATSSVEKIATDIIQESVTHADSLVRNIGVEAIGRMCNLFGSPFTNSRIRDLIDTIVANRDPNIRAGCALALGCIHAQVGGMAAGFHLQTIVGVLLSLCNDPHPVVHFWALQGLTYVADSAGLNFSGYVASTLGMAARLFTNDAHTEEAMSLATSNLEVEYSTPLLITKCVDSLINVLGPDLQDMRKERGLIEKMVGYFDREESIHLIIEGSICSGHLSLYVPGQLDFSEYVKTLQKGLGSAEERIRDISTDSLNDLVKRDAKGVFLASGSTLEDDLWLVLDQNPNHAGIQNVLRNWLNQTYDEDTVEWIRRCQDVLSKVRSKPEKLPAKVEKTAAAPDLQDEEVAGFAAAAAATQGDNADSAQEGQEFLKWQTRNFAISCLSTLISLVSQAASPDRVTHAETALQNRIGDVVRMAFSASTANVVNLRIWGLRIIDQVLKMFGKTPDPDFIEALLLEQYQAQISSALTPAFASDSSPELASEAINVCATFVATGIVTSVERMGRIFKLLVTGLESISEASPNTSIGDLNLLSPNAQIMLRLSLLSAWAQLQISSTEQEYLESIVHPYIENLTPLWLSSLQDFAKLRFEPDISSSLGGASSGQDLNELYAALNRETLLHFYQDVWLNLIDAIAILVDKDSDSVFDALDNRQSSSPKNVDATFPAGKDLSFREEPVAFFFILYGLAFEALVTQSRDNPSQTLKILQALQKILRPAVSGNAIYQDTVFDETMDTLDRLALTEGLGIQYALVEITRGLALDHQTAAAGIERDEKLSDDIEQLFELTRVMILVLAGLISLLDQSPNHSSRSLSDEAVALVFAALEALVDVAEVFPSVIKSDLYACIMHTFCSILASGACQSSVVPQALPTFKRLLQSIASSSKSRDAERLFRGCLWQFLRVLVHTQRLENELTLPCAKNALLAITIVLTTVGTSLPANEPLVYQALGELLDCLHDVGLAKVAANCLRSLLSTNPNCESDEAVFRHLFPRLVHFLIDTNVEDPENVRVVMAHSVALTIKTVPPKSRSALCATIVPVLLKRAALEGPKAHKETATRLLEVASADQAAFRGLVGQMQGEQREFLEDILKSGHEQGRQENVDNDEDDAKPSIALRMDF